MISPRQAFIEALEGRRPPGRVPHFELVFFLTMEAMGRVHPTHRLFEQWDQMSTAERELHRRDIADLYVAIARKYEHSAIFFQSPKGWSSDDDIVRCLEQIREIDGNDRFLIMHGDATYAIPNGERMVAFAERIADDPQGVKDDAARRVDAAIERMGRMRRHNLIDGLGLCSDYCFNSGPFLSPAWFDEFITPYLARLTAAYREMGYYVIKHTDGNIMPILDSLLSTKPHALHSLDPQGGVDIAALKQRCGKQVCLIGNVNCALMDTGTDEEVIESCRYALKHGMPGGGYIFSTSNCIYTGMPLRRYELMLDVWRREGTAENSH